MKYRYRLTVGSNNETCSGLSFQSPVKPELGLHLRRHFRRNGRTLLFLLLLSLLILLLEFQKSLELQSLERERERERETSKQMTLIHDVKGDVFESKLTKERGKDDDADST